MTEPSPARLDLVEEPIVVGDERLTILRPRSAEDLISEAEFAVDERLPYWAELWPSARALAAALAVRSLTGRRVVELGAGLGLPSLVAARRGAVVLATDWYGQALDVLALNARRLGLRVETLLLDWRDPSPAVLSSAPFDLVIAADVLYEARNVDPLCALIPRLTGSSGEVVVADPRRPDAASLLRRLTADGWDLATEPRTVAGRPDESGPVVHLHSLRPTRRSPAHGTRPSSAPGARGLP